MMITTDMSLNSGRSGLNTKTGQRNAPAPRMAGTRGKPVKTITSFEPRATLQDRINEITKRTQEEEALARKAEENKNRFLAGEDPRQSVGGSVSVMDGTADRVRKSFNQLGDDANRLYGNKLATETAAAAQSKALGLGEYNKNQGGRVETTYAYGEKSEFAAGQYAKRVAEDAKAAADLEAQRNNNRIAAKTAADAAAAADNAYSQRYAAAQQAEAQRFASVMGMFGNIAQPGSYKYWGV